MFLQRAENYWTNCVPENEIWKDRVRTEINARTSADRWQFFHAEYQQLYSRARNKPVTRSSGKKSVNFNRIPENIRRKTYPETTATEIGWRRSTGFKLETFGINIRGLKTKHDIYKTFNWPQN